MDKIFRKNRVYLYGIFFSIIVMITIVLSPKKYDFATEEPFIIVTSYSAGPDDYREMYDVNIEINNDSNLVVYTTGNDDLDIGEDAPMLEAQLTKDEMQQMKEAIEENKFWKLPRDVSTPSEDGVFRYVTVNLADESKEVGGLNPDQERFNDVYQFAWDLVKDNDYRKWTEEVEEHIWERNSLRHSKKTDFIKGEPFLILRMESEWTKEFPVVYDRYITIDREGNLVLRAEIEEGSDTKIGKDVPEITVQLTDQEQEELEELIMEHFWKLNETIINPDARDREESITVQLTEEEKTVRGNEPINSRFIAIRDYIIDLIDEKEYTNWEEEVEEDLWANNMLRSDNITDYHEEEPFFTLSMQRFLEDDSYKSYYHHMNIEMDGNIVLHASENPLHTRLSDLEEEDAPVLEIQITDAQLDEVKRLIEEHFWKIEELNYKSDIELLMDSMTVTLTHDTQTVQSNDPEDDRFMAVRNGVIDLIDQKEYEDWKKEAKEYLKK